jgi:hypothetical protein
MPRLGGLDTIDGQAADGVGNQGKILAGRLEHVSSPKRAGG